SIVALAKSTYSIAEPDIAAKDRQVIPFSAMTRISGIDVDGKRLRKGAIDAIIKEAGLQPSETPQAFRDAVERISRTGGTPLGVTENGRLLGVIHLKDVVKPGIKQRFNALRNMGIRTVMVTGDNPVTAAAIA